MSLEAERDVYFFVAAIKLASPTVNVAVIFKARCMK